MGMIGPNLIKHNSLFSRLKNQNLIKKRFIGYENEILISEMIDVDWINKHLEVIHSKSYAVLEKGVPEGGRNIFILSLHHGPQ